MYRRVCKMLMATHGCSIPRRGNPPQGISRASGSRLDDLSYWITQKGSSAHPRRTWTERDLLHGTPIQHFSLAVGPSAQRWVQPGDRILIYWPGAGNQLFMGTFEVAGPVAYHAELSEGWPYAAPLKPRYVLEDRREGIPLDEAMDLGGERIHRFARGACARGLYRIDRATFEPIERALAPRAFQGEFRELMAVG
jgi:hypothetical protein